MRKYLWLVCTLTSWACAEIPTDINTALEEHVTITVRASASNSYGHPYIIYLNGAQVGPTVGSTPLQFEFHFDVPVPVGRNTNNWDANDPVTSVKVVFLDLVLNKQTVVQPCQVGGKIYPSFDYRSYGSDNTKIGQVDCRY